MPPTEKLDTHHKALTLNLDPSTFGSFAEIGAGQEVARWFLVVGGASGTVAKSISAYDKEVSDDLYGSGSRYVSRQRLEAVLEHEWSELLAQLSKTRGPPTRFFSFVDTVSARNFAGTNDPHGWMGLRFQMQPGGPPNDLATREYARSFQCAAAGSDRNSGRQSNLHGVLWVAKRGIPSRRLGARRRQGAHRDRLFGFSRAGVRKLGPRRAASAFGMRGRRRGGISLLEQAGRPANGGALQESGRACAGILR